MRKTIIILMLLLTPYVFSAEPDTKLHKECLYPTVKIKTQKGTGTGVIVRSEKQGDKYVNVVVSCAHGVNEDTDTDVYTHKYKNWSEFVGLDKFPAKLHKKDEPNDLSVLTFISDKAMPTATISFEPLYTGNKIFHIGCGLGDEPRLEHGVVNAFFKNKMRASLFGMPGDSGSPVFHNYKIIGFVIMIRGTSDGTVYNNQCMLTSVNHLRKMDVDFVYDHTKKIPD